MRYELRSNGHTLQLVVNESSQGTSLGTDKMEYAFEAELIQPGVFSILLNNRSFLVAICDADEGIVNVDGRPMQVELMDDIHLRLRELGWENAAEKKVGQILAQIPGLITKIFHEIGDEVEKGDALLLMEAMKMENEIKSPLTGKIQKIHVKSGDTVEKGVVIIEIV